jgi:hypothetical protein
MFIGGKLVKKNKKNKAKTKTKQTNKKQSKGWGI